MTAQQIMSELGKSGEYYCTEPKALDGHRNRTRRHRGSREACLAIVTGTARALIVPAPMVRDAMEAAQNAGNPLSLFQHTFRVQHDSAAPTSAGKLDQIAPASKWSSAIGFSTSSVIQLAKSKPAISCPRTTKGCWGAGSARWNACGFHAFTRSPHSREIVKWTSATRNS
jgi:hypothetical protein